MDALVNATCCWGMICESCSSVCESGKWVERGGVSRVDVIDGLHDTVEMRSVFG